MMENFEKENLKIILEEEKIVENVEINTPYVLLAHNHFDFDPDDSNIWRMIRESESQNADIVTGSFQNELGQWEHRKFVQISKSKKNFKQNYFFLIQNSKFYISKGLLENYPIYDQF